jgi:hypothetical protein
LAGGEQSETPVTPKVVLSYQITDLAAKPRRISLLRASLARDHSLISPMVRRQPIHSPCASNRQMSMQGDGTGASINACSTIAE